MVWYKYLYADESIIRKKKRIKWKILHNAGMVDIFVITLSFHQAALLDIISTAELMQKSYPKEDLFIVGIAKGSEAARETACRIVMEVYQATGGFQVKEYVWNRHFQDKEKVCLCP